MTQHRPASAVIPAPRVPTSDVLIAPAPRVGWRRRRALRQEAAAAAELAARVARAQRRLAQVSSAQALIPAPRRG